MSTQAKPIDESDLRRALAPLRPDPEAFAEAVRGRVHEAVTPREETDSAESVSPWLSVAASVMPLPLMGVKGVPFVPLSKLPLGAKLVGWIALPVAAFVVLGLTLFAWLRIRGAQRSAGAGQIDPVAMQQVITQWWRSYGLVYSLVPVLILLLMWWGHTLPLLLIFAMSGVALVGVVLSLGRANAISRATVAQGLGAPLMLTMQLVSGIPGNGSVHLFDQSYVTLVLFSGSLVTLVVGFLYASPTVCSAKVMAKVMKPVFVLLLACLLIPLGALITRTIWFPTRTADVVAAVESFDHAPHSSASWREWSALAAWLTDTGKPFSAVKPAELLAQSVEEQLGGHVFAAAYRGGLIDPETARRLPELAYDRDQLLAERRAGRRIIGPFDNGFLFALAAIDDLTEGQRDHLAGRLRATLTHAFQSENVELDDVLILHELLAAFGQPLDPNEWEERVHELLTRFQATEASGFTPAGGFRLHEQHNGADNRATLAAIRLMELYGVPEGVDTIALRSWARPSIYAGLEEFVARQRLAALPDLPPLTLWDYVRHEQPLTFASLLVLLSLVAVFGSPVRDIEA